MQELTQQIKEKALEIGFHKVGIAKVDTDYQDNAVEHLQTWLGLGYQAEMAWMNNPKRFDIRQCMPEVQSVISVALNYYTPHQHSQDKQQGKISRYGWGRDYHRVMEKKLKALSLWLANQDNNIKTRYYVDTGPIQDKVWAMRSGIGWIAKNSNVITREYGSWVFLGEIITNLHLIADTPHTEHCGTCTRCLEACPTGAIASPFVVDANLCIAYHTIENRAEHLPKDIVKNLQGWIAGCDICQEVCPWNQRFSQVSDVPDFQPYSGNIAPNLEELVNIDQEKWQEKFPASALRRIKPRMWQRNARANLET
ncbi:tRNA epoxyqueuosine(34) reductase QueG [Crocosphaera watsonii WH 8501]|uniref:Epoxyqueuosine reductase n=5 Tax=Crocosphaera watsonii TaxID=263511 RepID=Q4C9I3_CROWT|nr:MULTISPECIES: tRNA epoxyqueuosine(34) reductase QueG [Crocosphaera]EAM53303.1 4Fe-4S cluster binding [Crocosphaera watsonii WH 8501]EHJ14783.1 Iron-sulfur cluster-binding protein [Crocosphaera watsonii WH 0003]MCH2244352.1 tRNA epoxyqueuosine(34) reductase QueG [Crocosphaera sp.]NQZ62724.1 tRNA epoxyqueuosine(34) reductase QueG [Crocosphaera sp.]CCQ57090.1 Iron-sulfur cluster-binding protein [Crocosphaera watsonii WH 0005]